MKESFTVLLKYHTLLPGDSLLNYKYYYIKLIDTKPVYNM